MIMAKNDDASKQADTETGIAPVLSTEASDAWATAQDGSLRTDPPSEADAKAHADLPLATPPTSPLPDPGTADSKLIA
jgi:hypothetical protein